LSFSDRLPTIYKYWRRYEGPKDVGCVSVFPVVDAYKDENIESRTVMLETGGFKFECTEYIFADLCFDLCTTNKPDVIEIEFALMFFGLDCVNQDASVLR
jgi:hypothetical protein